MALADPLTCGFAKVFIYNLMTEDKENRKKCSSNLKMADLLKNHHER